MAAEGKGVDDKDQPEPWLFVSALLICGFNVLERSGDRGPWFWFWLAGARASAVGLWREVVLPRHRTAADPLPDPPRPEPDVGDGEQWRTPPAEAA